MDIQYDPNKNKLNTKRHGIDFEQARSFEWDSALVATDDREDYGETRYNALGFLNNHLHVMTFTMRADAVRVISLRKATKKEIKCYER